MQLDAADLRHGDQAFEAVDLHIGLAIAGDLRQFDQVRHSRHGVPLKEQLAADAVRRAHDRTRPPLDVRDQPVAHFGEVIGQIALGDGAADLARRPQLLVGLGDHHAHHLGPGSVGAAGRGALARSLSRLRRLGGPALRLWFGKLDLLRLLGFDLRGRLVGAQPLEGRLTHHAAAGEAGEFDLGDQLRSHPVDVARLLRRIGAAERIATRFMRLQLGQDALDDVLAEPGADDAHIGEVIAAVNADQQRTKFAVGGLPAADHHLVAGAALRLGPGTAAAGAIRRIELLRHDAFERQLAGRLQNGVAAGFKMLDVADQAFLATATCGLQQSGEPLLALRQRQPAQILALRIQQIECKADQVVGVAVRQRRLQRGEIRLAVRIQRHHLGVDDRVRQRRRFFRDRAEFARPVEALACQQLGLPLLDAELHPVAVELDLMAPAFAARRPFHRGAELRRHEIRHRRARATNS